MSATTIQPVVTDTTVDHTDDIAAIEQIIANVETAYNTNDAELLTADFTANAAVVNAVGALVVGKDALLEANRQGWRDF